jgi:F0F1-type ATP synthase assembly protein I
MSKTRGSNGPLVELAVAAGIALGAPLVLGFLLDALLDRAPLMLFVGGSVGIVAGTIVVVRISVRRMKALSEQAADAAVVKGSLSERRIERSVEETADRP